jgi:hypothetical protein
VLVCCIGVPNEALNENHCQIKRDTVRVYMIIVLSLQ